MWWLRLLIYAAAVLVFFVIYDLYLWDIPWLGGQFSDVTDIPAVSNASSTNTSTSSASSNKAPNGTSNSPFASPAIASFAANLPAYEPAGNDPTRLVIPSIGLDTAVGAVGITYRGNMSVPHDFSSTGWYEYGPRPGEKGNAVIDGHVDNGWGLKAVFYDLSDLKAGDLIYVVDKNDATTTFQVQSMAVYDYDKAPTASIFGPSESDDLNLITCAGTWVEALKMNNKRLVVYSREIGS